MRKTYVIRYVNGEPVSVLKSEAWRLDSNQPPEEPGQAAYVQSDLPEYDSPVTGEIIRGRKARREDLKRNNCRPYERGEREAAAQRVRDNERAMERKLIERMRWINA